MRDDRGTLVVCQECKKREAVIKKQGRKICCSCYWKRIVNLPVDREELAREVKTLPETFRKKYSGEKVNRQYYTGYTE